MIVSLLRLLGCFLFLMFLTACAEADDRGSNQINKRRGAGSTSVSTGTSTTDTLKGCTSDGECTPGDTRCQGDEVYACGVNEQGCFQWKAGVDCALQSQKCEGISPARCVEVSASCGDGIMNADETDVDCGGSCGRCPEGKSCSSSTDCASEQCEQNVCVKTPTTRCQMEGARRCGSTGVEACQGGQWMEVESCALGCQALTCLPDSTCVDGEKSCNGNVPTSCIGGKKVQGQTCSQGCDMGVCVQETSCTAKESRCLGNLVQTCNPSGTAWLFDTLCDDRCERGQCAGACVPDEMRCNGNQIESCQADGSSWSAVQTCANGCDQSVCVEDEYINRGMRQTKQGTEVVKGCWTIDDGGNVTVPSSAKLEVYADCVKIAATGSLTVQTGATVTFHARTVEIDGSIDGASGYVTFRASQTLRFGGTASSQRELWFWADNLTVDKFATYEASYMKVYAMYGESFDHQAKFPEKFTSSLMPPYKRGSSTHPTGFTWNWSGEDISMAWERPFPGVAGYYIRVGGQGPVLPSDAIFSAKESISLPGDLFHEGINKISIVSIDKANEVGTWAQTFDVRLNTQAPILKSSSHPDQSAWGPAQGVLMEWQPPQNVTPGSWANYTWEWSAHGDHKIDIQTATRENTQSNLTTSLPEGEQHFHLIAFDQLGRATPRSGRYTVRSGEEPAKTQIIGTILDGVTQEPIPAALVSLEDDVKTTSANALGKFSFDTYARQTPYAIRVSAPGYHHQVIQAQAKGNSVPNQRVVLTPKGMAEPRYRFGFETVALRPTDSWSDVRVGPNGKVVYVDKNDIRVISMKHGQLASLPWNERLVLDVGWIGDDIWVMSKDNILEATEYEINRYDGALKGKTRPTRKTQTSIVGRAYKYLNGRGIVTSDSILAYLYSTLNSSYMLSHAVDHDLRPFSDVTLDPIDRFFIPTIHIWNDKKKRVIKIRQIDKGIRIHETNTKGQNINEKIHYIHPSRIYVHGVAFDGASYHVLYADDKQSYLIKINAETLALESMPLMLSNTTDWNRSIVFDGTNLVLVHTNRLETRRITDHSLITHQLLPDSFNDVDLEINQQNGRMVLVYRREVYDNMFLRELIPE